MASDISNGQLRTPTRIPKKVQIIKEDDAPPPVMATGGVVGGVPGGIPGGQMGGVIGGIISSTSSLAAVPKLGPKSCHANSTRAYFTGRDQGSAYIPD